MIIHTGAKGRNPTLRNNLLQINSKIMIDFIIELWTFLKARKKLWLAPIVFLMVLIGGLLVLAQGSVIAPFIYTIF
tara:strand:+ start:453 stop:680 length:228 start_codon:yes stop_codon:yes gene_type:complete